MGNIQFIGELFKLKMLTESIMYECITKLFKGKDEESLECLCRLLTTIGKELDHSAAKVISIELYIGYSLCGIRMGLFLIALHAKQWEKNHPLIILILHRL